VHSTTVKYDYLNLSGIPNCFKVIDLYIYLIKQYPTKEIVQDDILSLPAA
jgi:hypothetical protein